jgi:Flp pilus assembly pilin Flp
MSDLITTAQSTFRNQCIEVFATLQTVGHSLAERARDDRGQTAAEYMGILFIVSAIIAAVLIGDVGGQIKKQLHTIVNDISHGKQAK